MTPAAQHPSRDELLAMAYVDDQLDPAAKAEFEGRLSREEALREEVTSLRRLDLIARTAAPPENIDIADCPAGLFTSSSFICLRGFMVLHEFQFVFT